MHSVIFGERDSLRDWGIYLVSAPSLESPAVKTKYLDSPGMDGAIDLTSAIRGFPVYQNRTGELVFASADRWAKWNARRGQILDYLHGLSHILQFQDDPGWYWVGSFAVKRGDELPRGDTVTIQYNVEPYKWAWALSTDPWLWDPFSFVDGVIRPAIFGGIDISDGASLDFSPEACGSAPLQPLFLSDVPATVTVTVGTTTHTTSLTAWLPATVPGLVLYRGKWLYGGREATVAVAQSGSAAETLAITQQPVDATGEASTRVTFHVEATGDNPTFQWQYKNTSGGNWTTPTGTTFIGKDTPTVSIPVTDARNGYQFRCKVTSGTNTVTSNAATLTMATPTFAILQQPQRQTAAVGADAVFYCGAQGSGVTYQWQKKMPVGEWTNVSGGTENLLTVTAAADDHGALFRCLVTSGSDTLESSAAELRVIRETVRLDFRPGRL